MVLESISKFFRLVLNGVYIDGNVLVASLVEKTRLLLQEAKGCTRGVQKIRGKMLPFLHRLSNRAGITAHNTATYVQLIGYNIRDVSRLRALQLSSRQRYIAQTGPFYVAF